MATFAPKEIGVKINEINVSLREIGKLLWYVEDVFFLLDNYKAQLIEIRDTQSEYIAKAKAYQANCSNDETLNILMVQTTERAEFAKDGIIAIQERTEAITDEGFSLIKASVKIDEAKEILLQYYEKAADIKENQAVAEYLHQALNCSSTIDDILRNGKRETRSTRSRYSSSSSNIIHDHQIKNTMNDYYNNVKESNGSERKRLLRNNKAVNLESQETEFDYSGYFNNDDIIENPSNLMRGIDKRRSNQSTEDSQVDSKKLINSISKLPNFSSSQDAEFDSQSDFIGTQFFASKLKDNDDVIIVDVNSSTNEVMKWNQCDRSTSSFSDDIEEDDDDSESDFDYKKPSDHGLNSKKRKRKVKNQLQQRKKKKCNEINPPINLATPSSNDRMNVNRNNREVVEIDDDRDISNIQNVDDINIEVYKKEQEDSKGHSSRLFSEENEEIVSPHFAEQLRSLNRGDSPVDGTDNLFGDPIESIDQHNYELPSERFESQQKSFEKDVTRPVGTLQRFINGFTKVFTSTNSHEHDIPSHPNYRKIYEDDFNGHPRNTDDFDDQNTRTSHTFPLEAVIQRNESELHTTAISPINEDVAYEERRIQTRLTQTKSTPEIVDLT